MPRVVFIQDPELQKTLRGIRYTAQEAAEAIEAATGKTDLKNVNQDALRATRDVAPSQVEISVSKSSGGTGSTSARRESIRRELRKRKLESVISGESIDSSNIFASSDTTREVETREQRLQKKLGVE